MTTDDENHIIRTTPKRLAKGLGIVVGIMIVGAVIALSQWDHMASVPPQSSKLKPKFDLSTSVAAGHGVPVGAPVASSAAVSTAEAPAAAAKPKADATLTIMEGAATQGNPDYDPDELSVKKGNTILVDNLDLMPHNRAMARNRFMRAAFQIRMMRKRHYKRNGCITIGFIFRCRGGEIPLPSGQLAVILEH